ncbi:MAG: hypothetical protein SOR77_00440 [Peptoniphilus sp.]|uniref:hypothetical protein n=1 Tax=Peptoniphilus sp. TaxID=1971214 RepID=UPI002A758E45|nr:hypothetical protein [Peptoniphilus sp.]MDY2986077.1 hypothetical protein [Peptoniphilus sp.]
MRANKNNLIELIEYLLDINIDKIQILGYESTKGVVDKFKVNFSEEIEFINSLAKFIVTTKKDISKINISFLKNCGEEYLKKLTNGIYEIKNGGYHKCPIERDTIFLDNRGKVFYCDSYNVFKVVDENKIYEIDSLIDRKLSEISKRNEFIGDIKNIIDHKKIFDNWEPCSKCKYLYNSCIPCLKTAFKNLQNDVIFEKCYEYNKLTDKLY